MGGKIAVVEDIVLATINVAMGAVICVIATTTILATVVVKVKVLVTDKVAMGVVPDVMLRWVTVAMVMIEDIVPDVHVWPAEKVVDQTLTHRLYGVKSTNSAMNASILARLTLHSVLTLHSLPSKAQDIPV